MCDIGSHAHPLYLLQLDPGENIPNVCAFVCVCVCVCVCLDVYVGAWGYMILGGNWE